MDPLTQGALGAAVALLGSRKESPKISALCGALGGMAADLDILIRSSTDSLLAIYFHRHFTHSLSFIPFGAALVAVFLWLLTRRQKINFQRIYWASFLGYATHGLLDACTSYGTLLWWPFSYTRVSWSFIAIVDPIYTCLLLIGIFSCLLKSSHRTLRIAFALSCFYILLGAVQKNRAEKILRQDLLSRGLQNVSHFDAKPTVLNLWLWRVNFRRPGEHCVSAVYNGPWGRPRIYEGPCIESLDVEEWANRLPSDSPLLRDLRRFSWFSQDVIGLYPPNGSFVSDLRYSLLPNSFDPLWGIRVNFQDPSQPASFQTLRNVTSEKRRIFFTMLAGKPLP